MPQNKISEPNKKRTRPSNEAVETKKLCHIADEIKIWDKKDEIRKNLCQHTEITKHIDGKYYCLFHLPTEDKDKNKFEKKFFERLTDVETDFAEAEKLSEAEQKTSKRNIFYDFRYVWFPDFVQLTNHNFVTAANFSRATFTSGSNFSGATFTSAEFNGTAFTSVAYFISTIFTSSGDFSSAIFTYLAFFRSTIFMSADFTKAIFESADFREVTFASAVFINTIFTSDVDFSEATFVSSADFSRATFEKKSQTYFDRTNICSFASFDKTEIEGYVEFEGNVFLDRDAIKKVEKKLTERFAYLKEESAKRKIKIEFPPLKIADDQEAILNFQNIRLRNPERVSFNSTKLRPSWFVNVDEARKIVFNDVEWLNTEIDINRDGLEKELKSLKERKIIRRERSLIKACNQLADNAETNRRFEEARSFRKNALALDKKITCHVHFAIDANKKGDIWEKVCGDYPAVNENGGNYYCLWHNPDKNKSEIFLKEFEARQARGHSDFQAVTFPITVDYSPIRKDDEGNEVKIPSPEKLDFTGATFQKSLIFQNEFEIRNLNLSQAHFEADADLDFKKTVCKVRITLDKSVFAGKLFLRRQDETFFQDPSSALTMRDVRFENPKNANFDSIRLRPHYFINADASKFNFHNCDWKNVDGGQLSIQEEIDNCKKQHRTLAQISNHLAVNYEENREYELSSYFRYMAMEATRLEYKGIRWVFNLYWIYKLSSGYGERWRRALGLLLGILIGFGIFYATPFAKFDFKEKTIETEESSVYKYRTIEENKAGMNNYEGIIYSLAVASFQRPDPKPSDTLTRFIVTLETILAPLQAALLALAIRRKFMR